MIPPTISDQIRLWELERARLTFTEGILYNQFLSQADFEMLRDYAKVRKKKKTLGGKVNVNVIKSLALKE